VATRERVPHKFRSAIQAPPYTAPEMEKLAMPKQSRNCHTGLDQRCRDNDGEIRQKNGSTLVGTLRKTYGEDFAAGVRSDMKLDTLLDRTGADSLTDLVRNRGRI